MSTKTCPDCKGEGEYVGLDKVEDPCKTCQGRGEVEDEDDDESDDTSSVEEAADQGFELDEEDLDDFIPFAHFLDDLGMYTQIHEVDRQCSQSLLVIRQSNIRGLKQYNLSTKFVVDVIPNGGSFEEADSCVISRKDLTSASSVTSREVAKIIDTEEGREALMDFLMYRDHSRIVFKFSDGMERIEQFLEARSRT